VHCSDGWDRTSQVTSLAQLLLDPYYRTTEGFYTLVEKEWVHFGHMFDIRTDNGKLESSSNEWSPIFAQWLNIVWSFVQSFPSAFEFDSSLLEQLLDNTYSPKLYCGTSMPHLWEGMDSACKRRDYHSSSYDGNAPLQLDCVPVGSLWEAIYYKFSLPNVERKIRQRMGLSYEYDHFGDILSRFVKDTVHLLQEGREENKTLPLQFAAFMNFLIEGKSEHYDFWIKVAKDARDILSQTAGLLHTHFEITDSSAREGARFQSYNLFRTRKDAELSLEIQRQFIQNRGLCEFLVLEVSQIIPV